MTSYATKASTPRSHLARLPPPWVVALDDTAGWLIPRTRSRCAHYQGQPSIRLRTSTRSRKERINQRAPHSGRLLCGDRGQPFLAQRTPNKHGHMVNEQVQSRPL